MVVVVVVVVLVMVSAVVVLCFVAVFCLLRWYSCCSSCLFWSSFIDLVGRQTPWFFDIFR